MYQYHNHIALCADIITQSQCTSLWYPYGNDIKHNLYSPIWTMGFQRQETSSPLQAAVKHEHVCAWRGEDTSALIVSSRNRDRLVSGNVFITCFFCCFSDFKCTASVCQWDENKTRTVYFNFDFERDDLKHTFNTLRQMWKWFFNIFCATFQNNVLMRSG